MKRPEGGFVLLMGILTSEEVANEAQGTFANPVFLAEDASFDSQHIGYLQFGTLAKRRCDDGVCIVLNP